MNQMPQCCVNLHYQSSFFHGTYWPVMLAPDKCSLPEAKEKLLRGRINLSVGE